MGSQGLKLLAASTAAVVVTVDQITKAWAVEHLQGEPSRQVLGDFLQLTYATNSGAAFSLGNGSTFIFTTIAAAVMVGLVAMVWRTTNAWWALAFGLMFGGAMGNFIDRWYRPPHGGQGHVVDFLELPMWPVFNVADMAVVGAAILIVVLSLRDVSYRSVPTPVAS